MIKRKRKNPVKVSKKKKHKEKKKELKILAIDPASELGWALSYKDFGTWDLKTRKDESMGMKILRLKAKLNEIYLYEKFDIIAYERPAGRHAASVIHQSKLVGKIEEWCEEMHVEYEACSASEMKKFATGKGNAGKPAMVQAAKDRLGYPQEFDNDNEADALWLLALVRHKLGIDDEL